MEFKDLFLQALLSNPQLGPNTTISDYLPFPIHTQNETTNHLPYPLAFAKLQPTYPYWYELEHLDAFCIIHTESGSGSLHINGSSYTLSPDTIAFIDCSKYHKLEIKHWPWQYNVIFLKGNTISYFYDQFHKDDYSIHETKKYSNIQDSIHTLLKKTTPGQKDDLIRAQMIINILSEVILEKDRIAEDTTPEYLREIKHLLDTDYSLPFRLDDLEKKYNTSKYRICREFVKFYNDSPLQYVNKVRIQHAKRLLLESDQRINEIGHQIGIDNTNHFIHLFKKETGVTPLIFRKQTPVRFEP